MNTMWDYRRCVQVFSQELALLKKISSVQDSVRHAVLAREWTDFDWKMAEINQLGMELGVLEQERAGLFAALTGELMGNSGQAAPFYTIVSRLPEEERRALSDLFRTIKMETIKMRAVNESFLNYLNEAKTMAAAYLEALFPARGGKLYTRKGGQAAQELKSMVFNRHI
ncbi:MAG: hypothetical protein LBC62_00900 [Treponema sp.]|jgi:hypothetical protein|nr:hypothetical protein [Treponema sp.]